jgi:metal-responsive CopG/Arc/MetJ family transcriptional regulator
VVPHTKLYPVRIILPMTADMLAHLDAVRGSQERVTVIRKAVEHELKRREMARRQKRRFVGANQ